MIALKDVISMEFSELADRVSIKVNTLTIRGFSSENKAFIEALTDINKPHE